MSSIAPAPEAHFFAEQRSAALIDAAHFGPIAEHRMGLHQTLVPGLPEGLQAYQLAGMLDGQGCLAVMHAHICKTIQTAHQHLSKFAGLELDPQPLFPR